MTVQMLADTLNLKILAGENGLSQEIRGGYCGDLLSWVMGQAKSQDVWLTVMGNINAVAVASLADVACVLLCENAVLDDDAKAKADIAGIPVFVSEKPAFELATEILPLL